MKGFFKYVLATVVGLILTSFIGFLFMMIFFAALVGSVENQEVSVKPKSILKITFDQEIVDRSSNNPFESINWATLEPEPKIGLNDILDILSKAKDDDNIKGIYLEMETVPAGIATVQEIREALLDFKESGKFIISYSDIYSQGAYYLCSAADKVYLNPAGLIEFKGLSAQHLFFKNALEKLGIDPIIIRHGKFKSAIEPFILEKMSDENREQTMTYIQSIWDNIIAGISESRGISVDDLNMYADSMKISNASACVKYGLADGTKYMDEIISELNSLTGIEGNKPEFISLASYKNVPAERKQKGLAKDKIAVIYASGDIVMGDGDNASIGSVGISEAIREARLDDRIKAIVMRVNSPGGSALASEVIWREMTLAKAAKPVIVSMGDYAASGGYYISAPADYIMANENTLTGSIGVFGLLFNLENFMKDKIGITTDVASTNKHSDIPTVFRDMTEEEKDVIQQSVEEIYDDFVSHVAEGRKLSWEQVDSIGQGRVWSGANALGIGLIDEFGGLKDAIEVAKEKAGLEHVRIISLPKQKDPFEEMLKQLTGNVSASFIEQKLGSTYKYYEKLEKVLQYEGIQARLPFFIEIQ